MADKSIRIVDAFENNLKHVSCNIPLGAFIAVTGPSGAGKTSLVVDTIVREAEWRFSDPLAKHAGRLTGTIQRPQVRAIYGLPYTVPLNRIPRTRRLSTLGTLTALYDQLSILFARLGRPSCLNCSELLTTLSKKEIVERVLRYSNSKMTFVAAPLVVPHEEFSGVITALAGQGFTRGIIDGENVLFGRAIDIPKQDEQGSVHLDVLIDQISPGHFSASRVSEAVELALELGNDRVKLKYEDSANGSVESELCSTRLVCQKCGSVQRSVTEEFFRFEIEAYACDHCKGYGTELSTEQSVDRLNEQLGLPDQKCFKCGGLRVCPEVSHFILDGISFRELLLWPLSHVGEWMRALCDADENGMWMAGAAGPLSHSIKPLYRRLIKDGVHIVSCLEAVGLGYLNLNRSALSLSQGELQRARIASYLSCGMGNMLLVMDEPSVGLHPRDVERLLPLIRKLIAEGNSVIAIEHDPHLLRQADVVFMLGPGAGEHGGKLIAQGAPPVIAELRLDDHKEEHPRRCCLHGRALTVCGASVNNLNDLKVRIPLESLVGVCGVSGSGKTSLIYNVVYPLVWERINGTRKETLSFVSDNGVEVISGWEELRGVVWCSAMRRSNRRSTVATITGVAMGLRKLYALTTGAQIRGFGPKNFSFNIKEGWCTECHGYGTQDSMVGSGQVVRIVCNGCRGKRFRDDLSQVTFAGMSIVEMMDLDVGAAMMRLQHIPYIAEPLSILNTLGLSYLRLSEDVNNLSEGEYQRVRLGSHLIGKTNRGILFLFDEPTVGLHHTEVNYLIELFHELVAKGNSVVVIEHNVQLLRAVDYLIELGPGAGAQGGRVISSGTSREVKAMPTSVIGPYL